MEQSSQSQNRSSRTMQIEEAPNGAQSINQWLVHSLRGNEGSSGTPPNQLRWVITRKDQMLDGLLFAH